MSNAQVVGVGMTKITKPGQQDPYRVMASTAIKAAVADAGIDPALIEQAYAGYVYGDSCAGQHALYDAFMTGIPMINVNNNCSTGSTALFLARQAVESGAVECALAFGFEEMQPGALGSKWDDREIPMADSVMKRLHNWGYDLSFPAGASFGAAGHAYMEKYDAKPDIFAKVAVKSRNHAINNPHSLFATPLTEEAVSGSQVVFMDWMTRFMCCPPSCGAGAAIVCSPAFAKKHGLKQGVEIAAQAMTTDNPDSYQDAMTLAGTDMTRRAANAVYEKSGISPADVDVVELHDCFTPNEVVTYEGLQLCAEGGATEMILNGDNTYGGKCVVGPSGGLMSKGHPLGATGLLQCYELVNQLRGTADKRQVEGARIALQHNLGLGGAAVVTLYKAL